MDRNEIFDILTEMSTSAEHETEYAGRMYICCNYCSAALSEDAEHAADCLLKRVKTVLERDFAVELSAVRAAEEAAARRAYALVYREEQRIAAKYAQCPDCFFKLIAHNLDSHSGSHKCLARQKKAAIISG